MLLQALDEFASWDQTATVPRMYMEQPIRYIFDLDETGRLLNVVDTADPKIPGARNGQRRLAPYVKRANKIAPQLLADTSEYLLGIPKEERRADRAATMRKAMIALTNLAALDTGEPTVQTVAHFLESTDSSSVSLPDDFDPTAKASFRVNGILPIELETVQSFWGRQFDVDAEGNDPVLECIICGEQRPALRRHPLKIKGLRIGQTSGTDLISANEDAYFSYGLENSLIAPVCVSCAETYGNALNALLADRDKHHLQVGNLDYVIWTRSPTNLLKLISEPDEASVKALFEAVDKGRAIDGSTQHDRFYAAALSGSGSRVAVRSWIDTSIPEAEDRIVRYLKFQNIVDAYGEPGRLLPMWRLAKATVRQGGHDQPDDLITQALFRLAFAGDPLPLDVLVQVLRRLRTEQVGTGLDHARAALIKMVLVSQFDQRQENDVMAGLNPENSSPAYACGRLLAVLDAVQRQALGNPNATIIDRYYGAASTAPASVFGTLLHGTQNHMSKLRKTKPGAHSALERRIEEITMDLSAFPKTLTLEDQGMFALGFYHQRAEDRARARESRKARELSNLNADSMIVDTPAEE